MSDVVITILSTVSYVSLIRKKPVVMLGYTQLKEKGCTYEAFEEKKILEQIKKAISDDECEKMREQFVCHVAQMKKFYKLDFDI